MEALTIRDTWLTRLLRAAGLLRVEEHNAGTDFSASVAREPGYSALQAMSAYAAFPWVKACVTAKSVDLSGLPLKLTRGSGASMETIDEHEVLDLIGAPSTRVGGLLFRRQQWVDLDLAGNWYALQIGGPKPTSLLRMHPGRVRIQPMPDGQVDFYQYDQRGGVTNYDWSVVLHARGPSWEDSPTGLFGSGLIRALHNDLTADLAASEASAKSSKKGRPDAIISPKDSALPWTKAQVELVKESVNQKLSDADGGVLIMGGSADYKAMSWSPKDMEFQALRLHVREAVLAASGVPPSRVSLPTANYAQSKEMERTYWQSLIGEAALLDNEWTRLARMWDPRLRIAHDFSAVPALQTDRTAQVARIRQWWTMGISLADAAAFEGLPDLPDPEVLSLPRPSSQGQPDESASGPTKQSFGSWWRRASPSPDTSTPDGRAVRWRGFLDNIHGPVERGLNLTMRRFLMEQAQRYAGRLESILVQAASAPRARDLSTADLERLLAEIEEAERLGEAIGEQLRQALDRAFAAAMSDLGLSGLDDDVLRLAEATLKADLIVQVSQTTKDAISFIVRDGLVTGSTIQEMQTSIIQSQAMSPSRALTIARTETTRAVNRGTVENYRQAAHELPNLRMEWLSARDDRVRDSHVAMDGQTADVDGVFTNPESGRTSAHPGNFLLASEDINCRCTVIPLLEA